MITVKVNENEYNLEEKDAALIEAIQELTKQIRRVADKDGR